MRIQRRGGEGNILNSKAEFNRSYIPRLVVDRKGEEEREKARIEEAKRKKDNLDGEEDRWKTQKVDARDRERRKRKEVPTGGLSSIQEEDEEYVWGRRKRRRKIKEQILGENWGEEEEDIQARKEDDCFKDGGEEDPGRSKDDSGMVLLNPVKDSVQIQREDPMQDLDLLPPSKGRQILVGSPVEDSSPIAGMMLPKLNMVVEPSHVHAGAAGTNGERGDRKFVGMTGTGEREAAMVPDDGGGSKDEGMVGDDSLVPQRGDGVKVPDCVPAPSMGEKGKSVVGSREMEEDICMASVRKRVKTPRAPQRDGGAVLGIRRSGVKRKSNPPRLESSLFNNTLTIPDYYPRAHNNTRRRMMMKEEDGFSDMDMLEWERWTQEYVDRQAKDNEDSSGGDGGSEEDNVRGQQLVTRDSGPDKMEMMNWPGTEIEDDEWTEEALSFMERSGCDTPSRYKAPLDLSLGMSACIEGTTTPQLKWRGPLGTTILDGSAVLELSREDPEPQDTTDEQEEPQVKQDSTEVEAIITEVKELSITAVDERGEVEKTLNVRGQHLHSVNSGVSQLNEDDNDSTAPLTQHPSMVEGTESSGCTYVEGVCSIHGPATKKWRGGKKWGAKKNGLFGWVYDRKTYWVCEKRRGGLVGGPEGETKPTFIYMGGSKDAQNLSGYTTKGGKGTTTEGRFRDFVKTSRPARDSRK